MLHPQLSTWLNLLKCVLPVPAFFFRSLHADEIEQLLADQPATKAIIDHCGFCSCSDLQSEEWRRLLALAKYPQVCTWAASGVPGG